MPRRLYMPRTKLLPASIAAKSCRTAHIEWTLNRAFGTSPNARTRKVLEKWRPIREAARREAARRAAARANQSPSLRRSPRRQGRDLHGSFRAAASSSAAADDDEGLDVDEPDTDAKPE